MADSTAGAATGRDELMRRLRGRVQQIETASRPVGAAVSTGAAGLDRLLAGPGAAPGMAAGTLIDWVSAPCRAACLAALWCAWRACGCGGELVVIDPRGVFYPPAAAAWGVDLRRLLLVRPANQKDLFWSLLAALRCPAVGAVWAECERIPTHTFRALCLAAEEGGTIGMLVRPASVLNAPTWADAQLCVEPTYAFSTRTAQRRMTLSLTRRRCGPAGGAVTLAFNPDAGTLNELPTEPSACPLAPSA